MWGGRRSTLVAALTALLVAVSALAAVAADTGSISGTVTDTSNAPLENIAVTAYDATTAAFVTSTLTDATGHYEITGLAADTYVVGFAGGAYVTEYWDGEYSPFEADSIAVGTGPTVGIDAQLQLGVTVTGKVTGPNGTTPLEGIRASVTTEEVGRGSGVTTAADGTFEITNVIPGTLVVDFDDPSGLHAPEYWDDQVSFTSADRIPAGEGAAVVADASLSLVATLTGTLTDDLGPVEGIFVSAHTLDGENIGGAVSNAAGMYSIELKPGTYKVEFFPFSGTHEGEWYDDKTAFASADSVTVTGGAITVADAELTRQATISGIITKDSGGPAAGAFVYVLRADGGFAALAFAGADGSWEVGGLDVGSYKIRAGDASLDHEWTYFGGASFAAATNVSFGGADVTGLDIALPPFSVVKRLAGSDRYRTATAISEHAVPAASPTVFVASGLSFPDALAGGPGVPSVSPESPILLVDPNAIPSAVIAELQRLDPGEIVILGGTGAVSATVEASLSSIASVRRSAGTDRYATAVAISQERFSEADTVYLASGLNFPDALAGGAAAGYANAPILLTDPTVLPSVTRSELLRLDPKEIIVLGGEGAVAVSVADAAAAATGATIRRVAGANRFATAAAISSDTFATATRVFIASGLDFPDALAGVPAAVEVAGPLLLVAPASIPSATRAELERLEPQQILILGGSGVVSDAVAAELASYVTP